MAVELLGVKWWFSLAPSLEGKATEYSLYLCQVCAFNCFYFFLNKNPDLSFLAKFLWWPEILHANKILWKAINLFMERNPTAMLRTHKKTSPRRHPSCCSVVFSSFPSQELLFSLLLNAENGIFPVHHSELGSPGPSQGCTLVTPMALEPGVGPVISRLPNWLLSWINCFNYKAVLPKYADRTLYACFSRFPLPPAPSHPIPPPPPTPPPPGHLRSSFLFLVVYI